LTGTITAYAVFQSEPNGILVRLKVPVSFVAGQAGENADPNVGNAADGGTVDDLIAAWASVGEELSFRTRPLRSI
jgi:hypothetical protein